MESTCSRNAKVARLPGQKGAECLPNAGAEAEAGAAVDIVNSN